HRILRDRASDMPACLAFSPHGRVLAFAHSLSVIQLFDLASGKQLAALEPPHALNLTWLAFAPDGGALAAGADDVVRLVDLRLIRQQLAAMRLDWDLPPLPTAVDNI